MQKETKPRMKWEIPKLVILTTPKADGDEFVRYALIRPELAVANSHPGDKLKEADLIVTSLESVSVDDLSRLYS